MAAVNREGLSFEEWVLAAGLAKFRGGNVLPYTTSEQVPKQTSPGVPGTSDERFFDKAPTFELVRRTTRHYAVRHRAAWLAGEDPTDWRAEGNER